MSKNGLTMTIVFVAESANYGEGLGNISNIKKMTRHLDMVCEKEPDW